MLRFIKGANTIIKNVTANNFRLLVPVAILLALGACQGPTSQRSVRSPRGDYVVVMEKRGLGGCCSTHIRGRVSGYARGKPVEIFHIRGSQEASLRWETPYTLVLEVCDATDIAYKPRLWNDGSTQQITLAVINRNPKPDPNKVICELTPGTRIQ